MKKKEKARTMKESKHSGEVIQQHTAKRQKEKTKEKGKTIGEPPASSEFSQGERRRKKKKKKRRKGGKKKR